MRSVLIPVLAATAIVTAACSSQPEAFTVPAGTDVSVQKRDGVTVSGKLVEVQAREVVLETPQGQRTRVPRSEIAVLRAVNPAPPEAAPAADRAAAPRAEPASPPAPSTPVVDRGARLPEYRQVTVPAGTVLATELRTAVGSATSSVEDAVRATVSRAVSIDGETVIPAGTTLTGTVTEAARSGRVQGRARVAFRFTSLTRPDDPERLAIRTASVVREAPATKKKDAATIGGGAAAGAVIGGIVGGGDGAAKGAAIGGGAGTGVVLSTRGKEVALPAGTAVSVKLTEPLAVRVRVR